MQDEEVLTQVAEGVHVHQSDLLRNNTVVVEGRDGVLVVDPGLTESELTCLASDLHDRALTVAAGFATHPDWDHVLWHPELGDVPRYGTARCAAFMRDFRAKPDWRNQAQGGLPEEIASEVPLDPFGLLTALPDGTEALPFDGPTIRVVEHPAHAPGHAALVVEEGGVLIAGDMLSDVFPPMFDDPRGDNDVVADYLVGLQRLEDAAADANVVVPGHGSVGDADELRARIDRDRDYVHALLEGREPDDPRIGPDCEPGWEWVRSIYEGQASSLSR